MTCEQVQELIHAHIDGELDLLRTVEVENHHGDCESCQSEFREQSQLRSLVRAEGHYFAAPDLLRKRVEKLVKPTTRSKSKYWPSLGAAAALILALAGILLWTLLSTHSRNNDDLLAAEIVSSHVRSMMLDHLVDVPSSDRHTVKPWFNGKLDFAPEVKDFSAQGFPLAGGRLDYIGNRTVAALVYQRRKHSINLFIWPAPGSADQPAQQSSRQGYNLVHWTKAGTNCWVVSDVNVADLKEFAQLLRE